MDFEGEDPPACPRCRRTLTWTGTERYPFWECGHCGYFTPTL